MTTSATRLREKLMGFVNVQMQPPHSNIDATIREAIKEMQEEALRIVAEPLLERITKLKAAAKTIVEELETVGNQTDWRDGDETDRVYAWHEMKPLRDAIEFASDKTPSTEKKSEPEAPPTKCFVCSQVMHDGQQRTGRGAFNSIWNSPYKIFWDGDNFNQGYADLDDSNSGGTIEITEWIPEPVNADS